MVVLMAGLVHPAFAQGLGAQAATIQKQDQSQRDVPLPPSDLFALFRPSPAEIHRCVAGHRLNLISRSACKAR
jgi:hypothetical protein